MTEATPKKKKRLLLKVVLGFVVLILLLVALAPTILSMGIARGVARDAIAPLVNGDVQLGSVSLGWLSDQSIEALRVTDASGTNKADVSFRVKGGLLSLITSGGSTLDVAMSGTIAGTVEEDGSIGFAKLMKSSTTTTTTTSGGGSSGASSPVVATIAIEGLSIAITDVRSKRSYAITGLNGLASYDSGKGTAAVQLASPTDFSGSKGSIDIKGSASNLGSAMTKLAADLTVSAKDLRVPAGDREADFRTIELAVKSPGLGDSIALKAKAEGLVDGSTASTLNADLTVASLFNSAGAVAFKLANVHGTVDAANLPTSLIDPWLVGTNVRLSKDVGAVVELLSVQLPGGNAPISADFKAPKATLTASALVNEATGSIGDASFNGVVDVSIDSLKRLASVDVTKDIKIGLSGSKLAWLQAAGDQADAGGLSRLIGSIEVRPLSEIAWVNEPKKIAVTVGPQAVIIFGRASASEPFKASLDAPVAAGGSAAPVVAPTVNNVRATATIPAKLDSIRDASLTADLSLDPAFLLAVSTRSFTKPLHVQANFTNVNSALPPHALEGISVNGEVRLVGETGLYVEQVNRDIPLRDIVATLKSEDLTKEVLLTLAAHVDTASIEMQETVRGLPKDIATLDPLAVNARGTTTIKGLNGDAIVPWLGEQRSLIEAAQIRELSMTLTNEPLPGKPGQRLSLALGGQPLAGTIVAGVERERASIDKLDLTGVIGRQLVAELQKSSDSKVKLAADAPFTLSLAQPTSFAYAELKGGALPAGLAAHLTIPELAVAEAPGLASAVTVNAIDTTVEVDPSATSAKAKGSFSARGAGGPTERIEGATFDLAWAKSTGPSLLQGLSGTVRVAGINMPWIESLIGKAKGSISNWTGDDGAVTLTMNRSASGETVRVAPEFPRIASGTVDVLANGESVTATAKGVSVRVPAATLEGIVVKPGLPADAPRYGFQNDLALTINDATIQLPKGLAKEGDPIAGGSMNVALAVEPLGVRVLRPGAPVETLNVPALDATVSSKDFLKGIAITASDRGAAAGGPAFKISGGVRDLADAQGKFSADAAVLDLDADVQQIPTVLLDLLAATDGSLTRSLGDRVSLKASAKGLSKKSGSANATLTSPFVELSIPQLTVNSGGIARIVEAKPLTATFAMSPGIKEDILYSINTLFADIDLVKERATLTVRDLRYSLDGNLAKFDSDLTLDIGDIRMRNGKPISVLFQILDNKPAAGSEGRVEPLVIKVNNGRLTYDNFGLRLFKQEGAAGAPPTWRTMIDMKGDIDLVKKFVNGITTKIPASQVGNYTGEVSGFFNKIGGADSEIAKKLSIDVTMYGPLYDEKGNFKELKTKIGLPAVEDVLKDPGSLLKEGLNLIPKKEPAPPPAAPPAGAPKEPAKEPAKTPDAPKAPAKEKPKDKPADKPADKPKKPAKEKPAAPPAAPPKA